MKEFFVFLCVVLGVIGLSFLAFEGHKYFAPKYAAVDREVFEQTKSYNDSMARDLEDMRMQYVQATKEQKEVLRATILHRFSVYPVEKMQPQIREFYQQLQAE